MKPITSAKLCPQCGHTTPATLRDTSRKPTDPPTMPRAMKHARWSASCVHCGHATTWPVAPGERHSLGIERR